MKKLIITILFVFIFSIIFSSIVNAYYRDAFWECTRQGEQGQGDFWGRFSSSFDSNKICTKSCCILCVSQSPVTNCFSGAAKPMCSCTQGASTDSTPPELTVNSPIQSTIYQKRAVEFNLTSNEVVKMQYIDNDNPQKGYKQLCSRCSSFKRKVSFKEGPNDITIRATDKSSNTKEVTVLFSVDSKKPTISKADPKNGKYGNGRFTIQYNEENLKSMTLFYRTSAQSEYSSLVSNECESGKKASCTINIPNLPNEELFYYPEIEDIVGRKAVFREQKIIIDTINPEMTLDPDLLGEIKTYTKRLPLSLTISEKVILQYKNLNNINSRPVTLCRDCNAYNRSVSFRPGTQNIKLIATDNAGNIDEETLVFNII